VNTQSHQDHRHTPVAVAAAAALILLFSVVVGPAATAHARHPRAALTKVSFDYVQDPPLIGTPVCDQGNCVVPFSIRGRFSGGWVGMAVQAGSAVRLVDATVYANSIVAFNGTIEQCGTGTVAMRSTGFNRAGVTSGELVIVAGSGTSDLVGIEGNGIVVNGQADPSGNGGGTGTIDMRLKCASQS
jgi:hypothetical protein